MINNKFSTKIILKGKEKNQTKSRNKSNSVITTDKNKLIYEILKKQKLNKINDKARRISKMMETIGETYKTKNRNSNKLPFNLMNQYLTNINFRRSLLIQKKLKDIDKMNEEFDKEYINQKFVSKGKKHNYYDSSSEDENDNNYSLNQKNINLDFNQEQMKLLQLLFLKDKNNNTQPFSDYKRKKKLNDLKLNIEYVCGIKLDKKNNDYKNEDTKDELNKNTHYYIPLRNLSFMREKNKNENFIPSLRYDRTKLYFEKNYTPSNFRNESSKTYINKSLNTFNSRNTSYKNEFNLKSNEISHIKNNMKLNNNNELKHFSLSKIKDKSDIKFKSISNTKSSYKLKLNNTLQNTRNNSRIKYPVLKTENNIINRKKVSYILKKFLNDNCSLKSDLKFGINIISSHLKDYKKEPKKKNEELNLDIGKIREELNLNKISPIIKESDILVKNEKKMEKKIRKEDVYILRKVVNTVLQEDRLANRNIVYNHNSLNSKLKKIFERKIKNRKVLDTDESEDENVQMLKLFKKDAPDFFNIRHLSNLIKRYKTMKIK